MAKTATKKTVDEQVSREAQLLKDAVGSEPKYEPGEAQPDRPLPTATVGDEDLNRLVKSAKPQQSAEHKWQPRSAQSVIWGTVTKQGLVVGSGRNKKIIPPDEVYLMSTLGCTITEISRWYGITEETFRYNFYDYWQKGQEETRQKLRHAQLQTALNGNPTMLIWLGKQWLNQSDNPASTDVTTILPWQD